MLLYFMLGCGDQPSEGTPVESPKEEVVQNAVQQETTDKKEEPKKEKWLKKDENSDPKYMNIQQLSTSTSPQRTFGSWFCLAASMSCIMSLRSVNCARLFFHLCPFRLMCICSPRILLIIVNILQ